MDKELFVQKVKMICSERGIKPTNACKESGVGGSFINDIERGRVPSVVKVQMLADYLGVTTSELLGEETAISPGAVRISVLGTIPAGIPIDAVEDILDWEEIPAGSPLKKSRSRNGYGIFLLISMACGVWSF